jgi:hypothetical protein
MAQLFKPVSNTLAKVSLAAMATLPVLAIFGGSALSQSSANTKVGIALEQPVPFSHQHHAMELGIDCRFCHTSVEKGTMAGIPSTDTCMMCHSQIWTDSPLLEPVRQSLATGKPITWDNSKDVGWTKIAKLPEFVFFNHSIHVNRGISCNSCHGPVQKMALAYKGKPFFMKWCLDCHRNPEKFLYTDPQYTQLSGREQVLHLYYKLQAGGKLTAREQALAEGKDFTPSEAELAKGKQLVEKYRIKKANLEDCSICHH